MSRSAKQPGTDKIASLLTSDVLAVLRRPTTFVPPPLRVTTRNKKLQLFEVLSAYLMSLVESDFEWVVTPLQGDGGVDFYGEKRLFPIRGFEDYKVVIAGQCKASKTVRQPLPNDLLRLLDSIRPAIVYVFLMTSMSPRRIGEAERIFFAETRRQCRILDLQCVIDLLSIHREQVLGFIRRSLSDSDERVLRTFVQQLPLAPAVVATEVRLTVPERVLAGTPFQVRVQLKSLLLGGRPVHVRWNSHADVMLIKPVELQGEEGFCLRATETFTSNFRLKFVTYQVGEIHLGELAFEVAGTALKEVYLGKATAVDQYHPVFFWDPYERQRIRFMEVFDQAIAGAPQGIAVTGQGGAGKTRFCQELGYVAEQRGGDFLSVPHPQNLNLPYRIFGFLAEELLPEPPKLQSPREAVEAHLRKLHPTLSKRASGTLAAAFSADDREGGAFHRETMIEVLLVMLMQRARNGGCVLHLSDLHWASLEALNVLGELLQRLRKTAAEYRISVLMVFEGRVQTSIGGLGSGDLKNQHVSTAIFESFIARFALECLPMVPFTAEQSRAFLAYLFENSQSASRTVPFDLIPHQEVLIEEIARYGQGNPFHMIEQIKLLRQEGVVARNTRTGLIYLAKRPDGHYEVPASVHKLISLRLQFIEHSHPELALLVKAVGLIKDTIDIELFERLRCRLAPRTSLASLHQVEVLDNDPSAYIGFRHENYYQVVRDWPLSPRELRLVTDIYLTWYRRQPRDSPAVLYEEALVRTKRPSIDRPTVSRLLTDALAKAESAYQYQLAIQITEKLLQLTGGRGDAHPSRLGPLLKSLRLRSKLATFSIEVQDWAQGSEQYEKILGIISDHLSDVRAANIAARTTLNYFVAASLVELANTKTDLGQSHEALRCLTEARRVCETYLGSETWTRRRGDAKWHVLYARLLNRLGEAHWMDGNYAEALCSFEAATAVIGQQVTDPKKQRLLSHINLLDYGAVLLHKSPREAVRELKKSRALVPARGWEPHYKILANTTVVIGESVERFLRAKGNSPSFKRYLKEHAVPQLLTDFEQAKFYGLQQEQIAASLMLGVSLSLLEDRTATDWYMESIEIGFRSSNLESLWRGHLNLAQLLAGRQMEEASLFHCHRAAALLATDLRRRNPAECSWRLRHLRHPLRRIAQLVPTSELSELREYLPRADESDERAIDGGFFSDRIVFFWHGDHEYYPYGG